MRINRGIVETAVQSFHDPEQQKPLFWPVTGFISLLGGTDIFEGRYYCFVLFPLLSLSTSDGHHRIKLTSNFVWHSFS